VEPASLLHYRLLPAVGVIGRLLLGAPLPTCIQLYMRMLLLSAAPAAAACCTCCSCLCSWGDRPPAPARSFAMHWAQRCEQSWRRAFLLFGLGGSDCTATYCSSHKLLACSLIC
jgi:hypothetical protein